MKYNDHVSSFHAGASILIIIVFIMIWGSRKLIRYLHVILWDAFMRKMQPTYMISACLGGRAGL